MGLRYRADMESDRSDAEARAARRADESAIGLVVAIATGLLLGWAFSGHLVPGLIVIGWTLVIVRFCIWLVWK
jgi:hypothetical protein